ncbi:MAG: hypothetical protein JXB08_03885 [Bacilli bacterium]|nr:hypothetical protein [Bacilli bacterium]MBN2877586.1 hypothetical protein [Bacilli bacterium]
MNNTYIHTVLDGWTYLASVMDLYSRMVIGFAYSKHMKDEIVIESLKQARYKTKEQKTLLFILI